MAPKSKVIFESTRNFPAITAGSVEAGNFAYGLKIITIAKPLAGFDLGQLRNSTQFKVSNGKGGGFNDIAGDELAEVELQPPEKGSVPP